MTISWGSPGRRPKPRKSRQRLARFLRDELKLELSGGKTLITHARTQKARFLGYDITVQHCDTRSPAAAGQRRDRAAGAEGRDQGQASPLPAPRQTRGTGPAC